MPPLRRPRVKNSAAALLLTAAAIAVACASGCQSRQVGGGYDQLTLGNGPRAVSGGRAGANSETLFFEGAEAREIAALYGRENLPEATRLDGRMNIDNPQPMLATSQWPQEPMIDATRVYYTYLPVNTSSSSQIVPVYLREHQWGGGYYRRPSYYP